MKDLNNSSEPVIILIQSDPIDGIRVSGTAPISYIDAVFILQQAIYKIFWQKTVAVVTDFPFTLIKHQRKKPERQIQLEV